MPASMHRDDFPHRCHIHQIMIFNMISIIWTHTLIVIISVSIKTYPHVHHTSYQTPLTDWISISSNVDKNFPFSRSPIRFKVIGNDMVFFRERKKINKLIIVRSMNAHVVQPFDSMMMIAGTEMRNLCNLWIELRKIHRKKFNYNKEFLSTEMKYDNLSLCGFRQKTRSTRVNIQNIFPVCTKAAFSFYLFSFFGMAIWNKFLYHVVFFKFVTNTTRCGGDDDGGSGFWPISYFIVVYNLFVSVCASFWKTERCNT